MRRILFVVAGVFAGSFALGGVGSLCAHRGFTAAMAHAQDSDDAATDIPDAHNLPNVGGNYSGELVDHNSGTGTISMDLSQKGSKLSGMWQAELGGETLAGTLKGKVKPNWDVTMTLSLQGHKCKEKFKGTWTPHSTPGNEIAGTYLTEDCSTPDMGMVDEFD